MAAKQLARKNHYLPQFYLAQWTTPEPKGTECKLWIHWLPPSGRPYRERKTVAQVGYARDVLTQFDDPTVGRVGPTDAVERRFAREIDAPAAMAFPKLLANGRIVEEEALAWLRCMTSMPAQNPTIGPSDDEAAAKMREFVTHLGNQQGVPLEDVQAALNDADAIAQSVGPETRLDLSLLCLGLEHLLPERWVSVPCTAHGTEIFTADLPAATTMVISKEGPTWLAMALSPEVLLVIGVPPSGLHDHAALVGWYNKTLVDRALGEQRQRLFTRGDVQPLDAPCGR